MKLQEMIGKLARREKTEEPDRFDARLKSMVKPVPVRGPNPPVRTPMLFRRGVATA